MHIREKLIRCFPVLLIGAFILANLTGCSHFGPAYLSRGRVAYNDVLTETNAEQTLAYIVKLRYGVLSTMLAVSSITANVKFDVSADVNIGVGPSNSYEGNLVPISGGVAYEDNPSITYLPVQGEKHVRGLMAPIPVDFLILLLNNNDGIDSTQFLTLLISRINRIPNRSFIPVTEGVNDNRFTRFTALVRVLRDAHVLDFVQSAENEGDYLLWIHDYVPYYDEQVSRLIDLLDITGVAADGNDIYLPLSNRLHDPTTKSVAIQTRSVQRLARIFAAAVDVPEEDRASNLTFESPSLGMVGDFIKIRRSAKRPANAVSATKYRNWWYYIDGGDPKSKISFAFFHILMATRLSETAQTLNAAPLLTVPVK
jgi:hypothetical protein